MINAELLRQAGVDYDAGLTRFMNDPELYEAVLAAFAGENTLERAQTAFQKHDCAQLLKVVHEAKGSGGNAGLDNVYTQASVLVALLRSNTYTEDELIADFRRFEKVYGEVRDGVRLALAQP